MTKYQLILVLLLVLTTLSCNKKKQVANQLQGVAGACSSELKSSDSSSALFKLNGKVLSMNDVPANVKQYIYKNNSEAFDKNQAMLKEYALRLYLAKKQGKPTDNKNLPQITSLMNSQKVKDSAIKAFFEQNKNRMPPNSTLDSMRGQLKQYLEGAELRKNFEIKMNEIEAAGIFKYLIAAPSAPKLVINTHGFPSTGNSHSEIKVIEVSDYKCPHCQKAHHSVLEILKKYGDKISFTQINFSLRPDGASGTFVRGAYCASLESNEMFWKYHAKAFEVNSVPHEHSANHQHSDGIKEVHNVAKNIGLNLAKFKACLSSEKAKSFVHTTNNMLSGLGINSTPLFIVNNQKLKTGVFGLENKIKELLKK